MCQMASFFFQPTEDLPIRVHNLMSHERTKKALGLAKDDDSRNAWREGHYLPNGKVECNTLDGDELTSLQCKKAIKAKFPTFVNFINFCFEQIGDTYKEFLWLDGLASAKGLKLPKHIGGDLYLNGLTSAKGLKLPKSIRGDLGLNGLKSAKGLKLPEHLGGFLSLDGLTSAEGLELPKNIGGILSLSKLASSEGLVTPKSFVVFSNIPIPRG